MPERPLLIFPDHVTAGRDKPRSGFRGGRYHYPSFEKQKDRLTSQFQSMYESFVTNTTEGLSPESVLVIETVGKIEDFERAVRTIPGLEWLAEIDRDEIEPDEEFYQVCRIRKRLFHRNIDDINTQQSSRIWDILQKNEFIDKSGYVKDRGFEEFRQYIPEDLSDHGSRIISVIKDAISEEKRGAISGRLFLSMSNNRAMEKLLSLWKQWGKNGRLERPYGKWAEIFRYLRSLRPWGIEDRLRETGVVEYWKAELESGRGTASKILFEIELRYGNSQDKRNEIETEIKRLIANEKGNVIASCTIGEIRFHAIRAELPPESIEKAINVEYADVFRCGDVMFFRPAGQCKVEIYAEGEEEVLEAGTVAGDPIVAILDGIPFVRHSLLQNRIVLDDPDDFESGYLAGERKHGTAMASLVCHGELDAREEPLSRPIYFRPIMKPAPDDFANRPRVERIPRKHFLEDLIERSVRRIFEEDRTEKAVAPTVKIINLSIGDSSRMFLNRLSSSARLLDWLSEKYQVLFCVSAGNIDTDIDIGRREADTKSLADNELSRLTMQKIHNDIRNRKILAPADSINALTVGAIHTDRSDITDIGSRIDILPNQALASPISARGHGFRNSIKPEICFPGGRQLYDYRADGRYMVSGSGKSPGQHVATVSAIAGQKNRCVYSRGTSNAAALATRGAAQIFEALDELRERYGNVIHEENTAVLLKTLLVHGASWGNSHDALYACLRNKDNSRNFRKIVSRYIGYGIPDINRVIQCTKQRATAIGFGKIRKDEKHVFKFPRPPSLSGVNEMRRLTITLAWFSPINASSRKFRKANLSIELPRDNIGVSRRDADGKQVKKGTVQHEVLEGSEVVTYQDGDYLTIPVVCREDAGTLDEAVNYGLAVSLETAEGVGIPIYEEIKSRISISVPIEDKS